MAETETATVDASVTPEPLDVAAAIASVSEPEVGGIAVFVGTVRVSASAAGSADKAVTHLEYEAHPTLAQQRLREIAQEAVQRWGLRRVVAVHRTGHCELGEPTVVIACAAAHRAEALEACRWMIDTVKSTVPIWKQESYADGSSWVGAEGE